MAVAVGDLATSPRESPLRGERGLPLADARGKCAGGAQAHATGRWRAHGRGREWQEQVARGGQGSCRTGGERSTDTEIATRALAPVGAKAARNDSGRQGGRDESRPCGRGFGSRTTEATGMTERGRSKSPEAAKAPAQRDGPAHGRDPYRGDSKRNGALAGAPFRVDLGYCWVRLDRGASPMAGRRRRRLRGPQAGHSSSPIREPRRHRIGSARSSSRPRGHLRSRGCCLPDAASWHTVCGT